MLNWLALILVLVVYFSSCATNPSSVSREERVSVFPSKRSETAASRTSYKEHREDSVQQKLVEGANRLRGARKLIVNGRLFPLDCTGTVLAIYYYAGIDLSSDFYKYNGNGVRRLYLMMKDKNLLYDTTDPAEGDIIFWDNTYDRNNDSKWNDPLTHTGMVISTSEWGTVTYVHLNYSKGIVFERMNLKEPNVYMKRINGQMVTINAPMRMKGQPESHGRWLSSHLYRIFAKGYAYR